MVRAMKSEQSIDVRSQGIFKSEWVPELVERLKGKVEEASFSTVLVAAEAHVLMVEKMKKLGAGFETDDNLKEWLPSDSWVYWFLRTHMRLTPRRVNSYQPSAEALEKQAELHELNLMRLAELRERGLLPEDLVTLDEFGLHYFPRPV